MTKDVNQLAQVLDNFIFNIYDSLKDKEGVNPAKRDIVYILSKKIFDIVVTEQKVNMYAAYFLFKLISDILKLRYNEINNINVSSSAKDKMLDKLEDIISYFDDLLKSHE